MAAEDTVAIEESEQRNDDKLMETEASTAATTSTDTANAERARSCCRTAMVEIVRGNMDYVQSFILSLVVYLQTDLPPTHDRGAFVAHIAARTTNVFGDLFAIGATEAIENETAENVRLSATPVLVVWGERALLVWVGVVLALGGWYRAVLLGMAIRALDAFGRAFGTVKSVYVAMAFVAILAAGLEAPCTTAALGGYLITDFIVLIPLRGELVRRGHPARFDDE